MKKIKKMNREEKLTEDTVNKYSGYDKEFCQDCKDKIAAEMKKLSKFDILRPIKTQKKLLKVICNDCKKRIAERLKKENKKKR